MDRIPRQTEVEQLSCGAERYPYLDRDGTMLFEVVRYWPKRLEVVSPHNRVYEAGVIPQYSLYRLPELLAAPPSETVYYVEGEKDVETLRAAGLVATTNPGGCHHGWKPHYAEDLRDRQVVIVPDADQPGQTLAEAVLAGLVGVAASVLILKLPITGRDDVTDWLNQRGTIPRLLELASKARFEAVGIRGRFDRRTLIFGAPLESLPKLVMLALHTLSVHDGANQVDRVDRGRATASALAKMCSCHRVSAQRTVTELVRRGLLRRDWGDWIIVWELLAAISIDHHSTTYAVAATAPEQRYSGWWRGNAKHKWMRVIEDTEENECHRRLRETCRDDGDVLICRGDADPNRERKRR